MKKRTEFFSVTVPVGDRFRGGSRFQGCHGYLLSARCVWPPSNLQAPANKLITSDEFKSFTLKENTLTIHTSSPDASSSPIATTSGS